MIKYNNKLNQKVKEKYFKKIYIVNQLFVVSQGDM